jgi:uncharacterized membrane protein YeaQ/YmgE (transglycosylase-associated protein family)
MLFLSRIVLGSIVGFVVSRLVNKTGQGLALDIVLGAAGGIVGGLLFNSVPAPGASGLNLYSLFAALIGSAAVLWAWHAFTRSVDPERKSLK